MSEVDRARWERKYRDSEALEKIDPDEELRRFEDYLPKAGSALDLACGLGKNSLYLAHRGLMVTAADISQNGLDRLMQAAASLALDERIRPLCIDLDNANPETSAYDLIVVVRFLNRELFSDLVSALKPGGILFYKTFNHRILAQRPGFNRDFTIEIEDLLDGFSDLEVIADNRGSGASEYAFLLARRPG